MAAWPATSSTRRRRTDPEFYSAIRLSLVEQSPAARAAQVETLGPHAALLAHSGAALPDDVHGVIFANELLDALPDARGRDDRQRAARSVRRCRRTDRFVERFEEPSTPRIAEYLARAGAEMRVGWRAEVNLARGRLDRSARPSRFAGVSSSSSTTATTSASSTARRTRQAR